MKCATAIFVFARPRPPTTGGKAHIQDAWMAYRNYLGGTVCHMETNLPLKRGSGIKLCFDDEQAYVLCQLYGPATLPIEIEHSIPGVDSVRIVDGTVDDVSAALQSGQISTVPSPIMIAA